MPGFDRSGPAGAGPMTGGGRGICNTTDRANTAGFGAGFGPGLGCRRGRFFAGGQGRGFAGGPGRGLGRGFGQGFGAERRTAPAPMRTTSPPDEMEYLTQEMHNLEKNLQMIKKRIDDLQEKPE